MELVKEGAQRARWKDQIEDDLRTIRRLSGWRTTAQNRVEWIKLIATARATPALACYVRYLKRDKTMIFSL